MKNILTLLAVAMVLAGCQTMQYTVEQTFGDQREHAQFEDKDIHQKYPDNLLASMDKWVKEHLW